MKGIKRMHAKGTKLDTVGVAGSIPVEPTIFKPTKSTEVVVIPRGYDAYPAFDYIDGSMRISRIVLQKRTKRCAISVRSRRGKKGAA